MLEKKFMQVWPVFLDYLFSFFYEWGWIFIAAFFGILVTDFYLPGLTQVLSPVRSSMLVTLLTVTCLLTLIKRFIEPVFSRFMFAEKKEKAEVKETEASAQ